MGKHLVKNRLELSETEAEGGEGAGGEVREAMHGELPSPEVSALYLITG